jgi:hypothetical protein
MTPTPVTADPRPTVGGGIAATQTVELGRYTPGLSHRKQSQIESFPLFGADLSRDRRVIGAVQAILAMLHPPMTYANSEGNLEFRALVHAGPGFMLAEIDGRGVEFCPEGSEFTDRMIDWLIGELRLEANEMLVVAWKGSREVHLNVCMADGALRATLGSKGWETGPWVCGRQVVCPSVVAATEEGGRP